MERLLRVAVVSLVIAAGVALGSAEATPPGPPARGRLTFDGNFTTGLAPWLSAGGGAQCEPHVGRSHGRWRGRDSLTTWQGRRAVELDDTVDTDPTGYPLENCDLIDSNTQRDRLPSEQFIGLSFWIPPGFSIPNASSRVNIGEWHYMGTPQPPVVLFLHDNYVDIQIDTGSYNTTTGHYQYGTSRNGRLPVQYAIPPGRLRQGAWNEVVLDIRWASHSRGYVKSFYRVAGGRWRAGSRAVGIPTVNWKNHSRPAATFYDNFPSNYGAPMTRDFRLYYSDALIGTGLGSVESAMP